MATTKRRRSKANAGRRRKQNTAVARRRTVKRANPARSYHRKRRNPGMLSGWVTGAAAVVGGAALSKIGTQAVLGAKNTGVVGYAANAAATGLLAWGANVAFKDKNISQMVIAGGLAQIIVRVIGDYSLLGKYSSQLGIGDYQVANFWNPQRLPSAYANANPGFPQAALPAMSAPVAAATVGAPQGVGFLY